MNAITCCSMRSSFWKRAFLILVILFFVYLLIICSTGGKHNKKYPVIKCSPRAEKRGNHQKVVSFAIYGNLADPELSERYISIMRKNTRTFPVRYPGWIMRIYHDYEKNSTSSKILEGLFGELSDVAEYVDLCHVSEITDAPARTEWLGSTWRFLPLLDEQVDIVSFRDADSLIYERDVDAVKEWLESSLTFHVMRDCPFHCKPAILAGLWGAKLFQQRDDIMPAAVKMFSLKHPQRKSFDQELLEEMIWPFAKYNMISHDSYCCTSRQPPEGSASVMKPFPKQRVGIDYLGKVVVHGDTSHECPVECRPNGHKDWLLC